MKTLMNSGRIFCVALLSISAFGCATGGGGGAGSTSSHVRLDVGIATSNNMLIEVQDILRREQFLVFRTEPAPNPYIETEWRNQNPLEDEQELGAVEVRCRILVRGRERAPMGSLRMYQVTYTMEVQVMTDLTQGWTESPVTSQRTRMARDLAQEIRLTLELSRR